MVLFTLCAPVWFKSSRFNQICAPPKCSGQSHGMVNGTGAADVVFQIAVDEAAHENVHSLR